MRLRNITGSREVIADSKWCMETPRDMAGKWREHFGNDHPIYVEIGMGKGRFLMDNARTYPEINYIGIEKYSSVLLRGIQKLDEEPLGNVSLIRMEAEYIAEVFATGEVDRIYLNFSDPWPKDRHAKRRLPSREFLARYEQILKPGSMVEFKTDNRELFDFAVEEAEAAGWEMPVRTYDLHADEALMQGNIMTEYEERFSSIGNPICKYIIIRPGHRDR
ncbi:MAG: tRNA (guanosine(46)-N7)-methyltransferase TrmB [Lachnospiraceae bacterium]|nr:tRNA (guanosine(46)-N7)-methyltransferase TrmB [Lachnospiraceae bacterium]